MFALLLVIHVLICVGLIIVVLMQSSKGEGLAGAFGGGGTTGAVFGGRGAASFLSKATTVLAIFYMVSCLALTFMSSSQRVAAGPEAAESAVSKAAQQEAATQQPATGQQQTNPAQGGEAANPEDIFNSPPAGQKTDSGK